MSFSLTPKIARSSDGTLWVKPGVKTDQLNLGFLSRPRKVVFQAGNYVVDSPLTFPANCEVDGSESRLTLRATGPVTGHVISTGTKLRNFEFATESQTDEPSPLWHSIIHAGQYFGAGQPAHNWSIENVSIRSTRRGSSNGIGVYGDCRGFSIRNVRVPDSDTLQRPIAVHWGCALGGVVPPVETFHPSGVIENITVGNLYAKSPETCPVFSSAPLNLSIRNVTCKSAYSGLVLYGGDYGYDLQKPRVGGIVTVQNVVVEACECGLEILGWKYQVDGKPSENLNARIRDCVFTAGSPAAIPHRIRFATGITNEADFVGFLQPSVLEPKTTVEP